MALLEGFNVTEIFYNDTNFRNGTNVYNRNDKVILKEWHVVMIAILAVLAAIATIGIVLVSHYYKVLQNNRRRNELNGSPGRRPTSTNGRKNLFGTKKIAQTENHATEKPFAPSPKAPPVLDLQATLEEHSERNNRTSSLVPRLPPIGHGGAVSQGLKNNNEDYASLSTIYTQLPEHHNHPMNNNVFRMQAINASHNVAVKSNN